MKHLIGQHKGSCCFRLVLGCWRAFGHGLGPHGQGEDRTWNVKPVSKEQGINKLNKENGAVSLRLFSCSRWHLTLYFVWPAVVIKEHSLGHLLCAQNERVNDMNTSLT